jgi:serine/threonine-protein kinase
VSNEGSLPPGTLLAGKFRIERLLGEGAMGEVYVIRHELTRHQRALKLLHADVQLVPEIVRRFLTEASAAGRVGSPHLVETFDAGTLPSGEPYVVMELLEGDTLSAVLRRHGPLDGAHAAEIVAQAALGIDAAHAAGIVHRDLKPDNLFVVQRDGQPFVKILDFGVSKFLTETGAQLAQTRAGALYGSPMYMSPEQLAGSTDVDARADVFALGVVLYQCLSGRLPFEASTLEALSVRVFNGTVTPIETWCPELPPALAAVVVRALAVSREDRYPSARALAEALQPFRSEGAALPGTASIARESAEHAGRPRPWPAWLVAGGAVLVLALAGAVYLARSPVPVSATLPAPEASSAPSPIAPSATQSLSSELSVLEATALDLRPTRPDPSSDPPRQARPLTRRHPASSAVTSVPPTPAASGAPTTAEELGLRGDNPFR